MVVYWILLAIVILFFILYLVSNCSNLLSNYTAFNFFKSPVTKYIINRILLSCAILFSIATIVFFLIQAVPNNELQVSSDSTFKKLLDYYKNILPFPKKTCTSSTLSNGVLVCNSYTTKIMNLGNSKYFMRNTSVWSIIKQKCSISLLVGMIAYVFECIVSYPLGIFIARRNNRVLNKCFSGFYVFITSIPLSLLYYLLLLAFMLYFKLPTSFEINNLLSYIAPIASVTLTSVAIVSHWVSMYISTEAKKDYVTFARSKGLSEKAIFYKHIVRNALIPLIRTIPTSIVASICGFYILEATFGIPGSGSTLVIAIKLGDSPLIQGLILFFSFISVMAYIVSDLISLILDPRIKLGEDNVNEKH